MDRLPERDVAENQELAHLSTQHTIPALSLLEHMPNTNPLVITTGAWGEIPWTFYAHDAIPATELCTAVFCLPFYQGRVVVVEHVSRGFEFAGGHLDATDLSLQSAIEREVSEECGGLEIRGIKFFGYKRVKPTQRIPHREPNPDGSLRYYPFPYSYVPYCVAQVSNWPPPTQPTPDVRTVQLLSIPAAITQLAAAHNHHHILEYVVAGGIAP